MAIIIRLLGLDVKAGIEDIRSFFETLHIPDGGVYILGGSLREAFIAFNSERDAQLAMRQTGTLLKGSKVNLQISSMEELECNLKSLLRRKRPSPALLTAMRTGPSRCSNLHMNGRVSSPKTADLPPTRQLDPRKKPLNPDGTTTLQAENTPSLDSSTAFLLGICTVLQGLQSSHFEKDEIVPHVDFPQTDNIVESSDVKMDEQNLESGYVRLFGLPSSTTKDDICQFFRGLTVQEVIVNVKLGINNGCLVKFATMQHASDALLFNQCQLGNNTVEVRGATEKMWTSALQECEISRENEARVVHKRFPFRETPNQRRKSPSDKWIKSKPIKPFSPKAAKKPRLDNLPSRSLTTEYVVKVSKLPPAITKTEIKELFTCTTIPHKHVQHYFDPDGNRTDTAFIIFKNTADYHYAMNLNGCHVGSSAIEVTSVTRSAMKEMMAKTSHCKQKDRNSKINQRGNSDPLEVPEEESSRTPDPAAKTCLFVRNMPADVQEGQIKSLFCKYKLAKENIFLLRDNDGNGIGEAVVQLKSSKHAALAQRLHRQDFLGSTLLITPINVKQMKDILGQ